MNVERKLINDFSMLQGELATFSKGYILIWYYDDLMVDTVKNALSTTFFADKELEDIVRIRAFNDQKELHVWRSGKQLYSRMRSDEEETTPAPIVKEMIVVGKVANQLKEKFEDQFKRHEHIAIQTKNYVGYNDIGQAGYEDSRFVKFVELKKG